MQESSVAETKRRFSFDAAALIALTATAAITLLVVSFSPAISFFGTKVMVLMVGTLVSLALYIVARLTRGNIVVPPSMLLIAIWFVPFAYALSTFFSGTSIPLAFFGTEFETDTLGFIVTLAVIATLFALSFRRSREYNLFFRISSYAFGLLLIAQVLLLLSSKLFPTSFSPLSNLVGSFSDLGMMVGLGVILSLLALRLLTLSGGKRLALWILIAVGFCILALVNSSTIWILVSLTALGLFIEVLMRRKPAVEQENDLEGVTTMSIDAEESGTEGRPFGPALVTLVISLFFLIGGATLGNALAAAFGTSFVDVRPSWQSTFDVGSHTYASSPLFGSGPGTFGEQWLKFRDREINDSIFWNIDFSAGIGYIPTSMVTTGILGTIAWLMFLGLFFFIGGRALLFRLPQERSVRFISVASFIGATYVIALAVFLTPGPLLLAAGFAFIGLFVSSLRYGKDRVEWGVIFARAPRIGFVIVFALTLLLLATVFAVYVVAERYLAGIAYGEAGTALARGDLPAADSAITRSLTFAPTDRTFRLAAAIGVAHMNQIVSSETLAPSDAQAQFQTALSSSIQAASSATQVAPNNYQNWLALGGVFQSVVPLKISGAFDQSKAAYDRAVQLAPTNPVLPYTLAQLAINNNDYPVAEAELMKAIALKNDYTQAILLLSQLQVQLGKADEALKAVEAAIYFSPNDPATLFEAGILRLGTGNRAGAIAALGRAIELNPTYANARFFLAVAYAVTGDSANAIVHLKAVAALSAENAEAVKADLEALEKGENPYPAARLKTLGVPFAPVAEPEEVPAAAKAPVKK